MGTENTKSVGGQTGNSEGQTNSTSTKRAVNSRGTGGTGGTGGRSRGKEKSEPAEKGVGFSNVDEPKKVQIDLPNTSPDKPKTETVKRGRPAGSTTKNKPAKPKNNTVAINPTHYILLLQTLSGVLASRDGMSMFALSNDEATQIATPLAAILSKNEAMGEFAGEYADHIALLIAAASIMIPKFMIYQATKPKKEKEVKQQNEPTITGNVAKTTESSQHPANVQNDGHAFNGSIGELISPLI